MPFDYDEPATPLANNDFDASLVAQEIVRKWEDGVLPGKLSSHDLEALEAMITVDIDTARGRL